MGYQKQKIEFPKNAKVVKHEFTTYDPSVDFDVDSNYKYLDEDLLQIVFEDENIIIDLGWYGNLKSNEGEFKIYKIKDRDWANPLMVVNSKSQKEITEKLIIMINEYMPF